MKAPLNTDNWSGSIKSSKAPLNTDDWNGFISADMSRKLSQNCQCITTPCNCGAIQNVPTLPQATLSLGCELADQIQKYGSYNACMKAREKEKAIQDMLARQNPIENTNKTGEVKFGDPLKDKKWIVYGLIAVAGYVAYKKFKK